MQNIATIKFEDLDTNGEAIAIIRRHADVVALCLSVLANGDIEVVMSKADAQRLLEALQAAVA